MILKASTLVALLAVASIVPGCAADPEADANPADDGSSEDELRALKITEADAGKTIAIQEGQTFHLALASNPSTGFDWKVLSTTRTLGYPYRTTFSSASGGPVGSGGESRLFWKTSSPLSMVGKHTIELGYQRAWETTAPARKLAFTIDIQPKAGPTPTVTAVKVGSASGSTVTAKEGQDIVLELAGPQPGPFTGWKVVSTDRTFGYPEATWTQGEGAAGDSGHSTFTWKTKSPLSMVGSHKVVLEIDRGHGDGVTKFEFTANITR